MLSPEKKRGRQDGKTAEEGAQGQCLEKYQGESAEKKRRFQYSLKRRASETAVQEFTEA